MLTDPAFAPWREEALKRGYASSLVLPLMAGGKAFGAITIYERMPDAFSEDETDLLSDLADDLAFGITSLRMREAHARMEDELLRSRDELEVRVRERTRELLESSQRLRESQRIIQRIADTTPDIVYIFDFARRHIIYANRRAAEFMGHTSEQLSKPGFSLSEERIHPDDRPSVREARERFAAADESDVIEYEYRAKRADGQWRWLLVRETLFARGQGGCRSRSWAPRSTSPTARRPRSA